MDEQSTLFTNLPDVLKFYGIIENALDSVLESNNCPKDAAIFESLKDKSYSYRYRENVVFNVMLEPKRRRLTIPYKFESILLKHHIEAPRKNDFLIIELCGVAHAHDLCSVLCEILDTSIDSYPKSFSCCSRYVERSNEKKCINPSPELAMDCSYRVKLKQGKIFYGVNRSQ